MENKTTIIPDGERLFFEKRDNGDLIVNTEKSSYFLIVATEENISVHSCLCLNGARALIFLKKISSESEEFVEGALKQFLEDI